MHPRAAELIKQLRLSPHREGGHYAEVFRSAVAVDALDGRGVRCALTSIYFLLCRGEASRWHRVRADEIWCHLEGAAIELHVVDEAAGSARTLMLGPVSPSTLPQHTVPADQWQAACSSGDYSLAACMVGPGFDFADFELMSAADPLRERLALQRPELARF